jgi:hypothetical protein
LLAKSIQSDQDGEPQQRSDQRGDDRCLDPKFASQIASYRGDEERWS